MSVTDLLADPRFEVLPGKNAEQSVLDWVPRGMTVTVTASPVKGLDPTVDLAVRLAGHGYRTVPHIAARSVADDAHLAGIVRRLLDAGIDNVFVPGGDATHPAGPFDSALPVLVKLSEMGAPFSDVGITGYPESHPKISDDVTVQAMWDKRLHATYLVSNVCFDPAALGAWIKRIRARGVVLPLYVGLACPTSQTRLLRLAAISGATESARFITRHPGWILRFLVPGGYSPDRFLARAAPILEDPANHVVGLHLFTFNQLQQTAQWRTAALATASAAAPYVEPISPSRGLRAPRLTRSITPSRKLHE
ncbi:MAG TPA: methylenetetrahydrofolate reductase [Streptosporangiaceae bacterium]|nr:methylenetetrahydrofolate reductase [Streptosporangiaceae bacterium]